MKISVCIPTYNRSTHLDNCLSSIVTSAAYSDIDFEVCVSDNCSEDETQKIVSGYFQLLPLKYSKNERNLGIPLNFLKVVSMAEGEFVWLIGDDDLLMPNALQSLSFLISKNPTVDFFYVNAYHLGIDYVDSFQHPFDTRDLPDKMHKFSNYLVDGKHSFFDLISPSVSFDFLGGMFLSVFRRDNWIRHSHILSPYALKDLRIFSHFDNTFPHVKIFSKAFSHSLAYYNSTPLIVCLSGVREWSAMYPLVRSFRLIEALDSYREAGLPLHKYYHCRNYALSNFIPDLVRMLINPVDSGLKYISLNQILPNIINPNVYFSLFRIILRKIGLVK